jgi:hypothetical protein
LASVFSFSMRRSGVRIPLPPPKVDSKGRDNSRRSSCSLFRREALLIFGGRLGSFFYGSNQGVPSDLPEINERRSGSSLGRRQARCGKSRTSLLADHLAGIFPIPGKTGWQRWTIHHPITLRSRRKCPLRVDGASVASHTAVSAPSSTDREALAPPISVRTHPGHIT